MDSEHTLTVERYEYPSNSKLWGPLVRFIARCTCGWHSVEMYPRESALREHEDHVAAVTAFRDAEMDRDMNEAYADQAIGRVRFLLDTYHLWSEEGTFTFPDGETWHEVTPEPPCPKCKGKGVVGGKTGFSYDYPWTCSECDGTGLLKANKG